MWQRLLRALTALLNMYSFYANPMKYILSLLMVMVIPYLIYIFWGSVILFVLVGIGLYFLYRYISRSSKKRSAA